MQATFPNIQQKELPKRKTIPMLKRIPGTLVAVMTTAILVITSIFVFNQQPANEPAIILPAQNETATPVATLTFTPTSTVTITPSFTYTPTLINTITPTSTSTVAPSLQPADTTVTRSTPTPYIAPSIAYVTILLPVSNVQMSESIVNTPLHVDEKIRISAIISYERVAETTAGEQVNIVERINPTITRTDDAQIIRVNSSEANGIESLIISISAEDQPILEWFIDADAPMTIERATQYP